MHPENIVPQSVNPSSSTCSTSFSLYLRARVSTAGIAVALSLAFSRTDDVPGSAGALAASDGFDELHHGITILLGQIVELHC